MSACSHNDFPLDNLFKGKDFEELNTSDPLLAVQVRDVRYDQKIKRLKDSRILIRLLYTGY